MTASTEDNRIDRATAFLDNGRDGVPVDQPDPEFDAISNRIIDALHSVYDPEIPVDIFELGLIYKVDIDEAKHVHVDMTLTSPGCPVAGILPEEVRTKVESVDGVASASVDVVWDPPWNPGMMSEEAKLELGILY